MPPRFSMRDFLPYLGRQLNTANQVGQIVLAPQASLQDSIDYQDDVPPQLRVPNARNSWDLLQLIAQERQQALQAVARKVRAAGGTVRDVQDTWAAMRKQGGLTNPGDLIRGAGLPTHKMGPRVPSSLVLNPVRQFRPGQEMSKFRNPVEPSRLPYGSL